MTEKVIAKYDAGKSRLLMYHIDYEKQRVIVRWSNDDSLHSIRLYRNKSGAYFFKIKQVMYYISDFHFEDGE